MGEFDAMPNEPPKLSANDLLKEEAKFLDRDFNQCFEQMRHYDGQIFDICRFAFTAYTAVIGAALALYKYGIDKGIAYTVPAVGILAAGLLFGLCMIALVVRNRVYFVFVTRYINEHRGFFLEKRPLGFEDQTRMYTRPDLPPFFNWRSSQMLLLVVLSGLNSFLVGTIIFLYSGGENWCWVLGTAFLFWLGQMISAIAYLKSREEKSASRAVFGREINS
jgi:hypothetical protein